MSFKDWDSEAQVGTLMFVAVFLVVTAPFVMYQIDRLLDKHECVACLEKRDFFECIAVEMCPEHQKKKGCE